MSGHSYIRLPSDSEKPLPQDPSVGATFKKRGPLLVLGLAICIFLSLFSAGGGLDNAVPTALSSVFHNRREAVAALITSPKYLVQVLVLGQSLNKHEPHRDHLLYLPDTTVSRFDDWHLDLLKRNGWIIKEVDFLNVTDTPDHPVRDKYRDVMNKLHIWNTTEYDIVALIDGDAALVDSIDEPFKLLRTTNYPIAAVADISAPEGNDHRRIEVKGNLNAGAMWAKTDAATFQSLLEASKDWTHYATAFPEQNLLSKFFAGRWLGLDIGYNLMLLYEKDGRRPFYDRVRPTAKVLHYAADSKPWVKCMPRGWGCAPDHLLWVQYLRDVLGELEVVPQDFNALGWDIPTLFRKLEEAELKKVLASSG